MLGEILNTNTKYLASELATLGIDVFYQTVVGDNENRILNAYKIGFERADIIITTGGLGPTDDDLSKEIGAKYFDVELVLDNNALENMKKYFINKNQEMPKSNIKQAYVPKDSIILKNDNGTAPGCIIQKNNKILIMLPGPPNEVVPMFENEVKPFLTKLQTKALCSKSLNLAGIGESEASEKIQELMLSSTNPTIAPYAKNNEVRFRVTASGKTLEEAKTLINPTVYKLYSIFKSYIYGEDDETLAQVVAKKLIQKNMTISVAESCTGGMLASTLVDFAGISSVFLGGIIAYSNDVKVKELNVDEKILKEKGAVSEEVAKEMAQGVLNKFNSNIGLSITGIAGPKSDSTEKPVGLVYIGIANGKETFVKKLNLSGNREKIRSKAVTEILNELRLILGS